MNTPIPPSPENPVPDESLPDEADIRKLYASQSGSQPGPELDARVHRMAARALEEDAKDAPGMPHADGNRGRGRVTSRTRGETRARRRRSLQPWWLAAGSFAVVVVAVGLARHLRTHPQPHAVPVSATTASKGDASIGKSTTDSARTLMAPAAKRTASPVKVSPPVPPPSEPVRTPKRSAVVPAPPPPVMEMSANAVAAPLSRASSAKAAPARTSTAASAKQDQVESKALQHIRDLFAAGHTDKARRLLQDFHHAHPQRQLPADLRAELPRD